jgi:hypothetical protein
MVYLKLRYGDKAFVLSLDALIAIIVIFIATVDLISTVQRMETMPNLYLSKKGSDIAALIDNNGKINALDRTAIINEVSNLSSYENIEMNITSYNPDLTGKSNINFSIGGQPNSFVSSGKRFFVVSNNVSITKFGVIKYKIWRK